MAQAYLDFANYGYVLEKTEWKIINLITQNKVYSYLSLPLLIMSNNIQEIEALRNKFEWLDFDYTLKNYRQFFASIKNAK